MNTEFNDLEWHDAIIEYIHLDRHTSSKKSTVELSITWPDRRTSKMEFFKCYELSINMNMGIHALESILHADCLTESPQLTAIYNTWKEYGVNLNLNHYIINTNSTNSLIQIYAEGFNLTYGHYLPEEENDFPDLKENSNEY